MKAERVILPLRWWCVVCGWRRKEAWGKRQGRQKDDAWPRQGPRRRPWLGRARGEGVAKGDLGGRHWMATTNRRLRSPPPPLPSPPFAFPPSLPHTHPTPGQYARPVLTPPTTTTARNYRHTRTVTMAPPPAAAGEIKTGKSWRKERRGRREGMEGGDMEVARREGLSVHTLRRDSLRYATLTRKCA